MNTDEIIKKYSSDIPHAEAVSKLSSLLFEKIYPHFVVLQNYLDDFPLLLKGALLHDIGISFERAYNLPHHKAGAKYIIENKPDDVKEEDVKVLACLIRYHRKSLPDEFNHGVYKSLKQPDKARVNYLGSIIKLADAFDEGHIGLIENFDINYDKKLNILTLLLSGNIMLNKATIEAANKKKDFMEAAYRTKIEFAENK